MSTWYGCMLQCPCGHAFDARLVRGANVMRSGALREAALTGTLNTPTCPACGVARPADASVVYADFARGHWIAVARESALANWGQIERAAVDAFRSCLDTIVARDLPAMHVRVVFDLDELRERLVIWDAGLDDAVVECAKLSCLAEDPALRGPEGRIRVTGVAGDGALAMRSDRGTWTVPRTVIDAIAVDESWRLRFPALFEPGFVSIDRYLRT
jgi:CpXC protein